jgi:hypothetical protein
MQSLLKRWIIPAGVATFVTSGTALAADVTSTWKAASGDWSAPTNWTPKTNFPNNGNGGLTYDAVLGNDGTITLDRDITIQKYTQSNGTLTSSGNFTLTVNELMTWSGGTITGNGTVVANGGIDLSGASTKSLEYGLDVDTGRTLINNGTANLSGGNLQMATSDYRADSFFTNNGIFNVTAAADIVMSSIPFGVPPIFANAATGIFNKSGAATTTQIGVLFRNSGTVNVDSGTLQISYIVQSTGGTFAVDAGATLDFNWTNPNYTTLDAASSITAAGDVTFSEGTVEHSGLYVNSGATNIAGGRLNFLGTTPASIGTLNLSSGFLQGSGSVNVTTSLWTGGAMVGPGATTITGTLTISGTGDKWLGPGFQDGSRTLINNGTTNLSSPLGMLDGSKVINHGTFNLTGDSFISGVIDKTSFTNAATGIFNMSSIAWVMNGISFANSGTVNLYSGILGSSQFTQSAGTLNLLGGSISGALPLHIQGGFVTGSGTIENIANTGGTIAPGNSVGAISITGNLTLGNNSKLSIDLGGRAQGTQYDFLSEGGSVALTLDGTLTLNFINGFQDAVTASDSFTILTSNLTLLGAFDNVANGARLDVANFPGSFQVNYGAGSPFGSQHVVLSAFVIPEPSAALLLALGCASLGLRRLPRPLRF